MAAEVIHGDCIEVMRALPDNSVDSIVTDPPYGLGFMGKAWDALPPGEEWARECLRVLKPGGHLLAFGGTRTWHRLAVAVEDAGFEIRDSIAWMYGSGFPKSHDVSKAIDKAAGAERVPVGRYARPDGSGPRNNVTAPKFSGTAYNGGKPGEDGNDGIVTAPATGAAQQWQGWGTALKPAFEPVVVARKPFPKTVAANVVEYGTGALNIDGCRIGDNIDEMRGRSGTAVIPGGNTSSFRAHNAGGGVWEPNNSGRWPANVALDETAAEELDGQSGVIKDRNSGRGGWQAGGYVGGEANSNTQGTAYKGEGGASRFFYVAKAPKKERPVVDGVAHATVKPLSLMRWLVRLVTPAGGTVLEPFAGSGTTVEACIVEGFHCIAIEREAEYLPLIQARIDRRKAA